MADIIKIKRSSVSSTPSSLSQGEMAYSEVSDTVFIGITGPAVRAVAGAGVFAKSASPAFTGTPTAPTASGGTNTTQLATTAFVTSAVSAGTSGFLTSATAAATYGTIVSPAFTGTPTVPTATGGTNTTQVASTAFVQNTLSAYLTNANATATYAPIASPTFTGVVTVPTATAGDSTTKAASTAFVANAVTGLASTVYVDNKVASVLGAAPATLDTLIEIDNAINNDPNFATTLFTSIATKLTKASNLSDLQTLQQQEQTSVSEH